MRIHEKIVFDIRTGEVLEDDFYEYDGEIAECKGGGSTSKSKPLWLDSWMKSDLYPALQEQYSYLSQNYPASEAFENWLSTNKTNMTNINSALGNAQSTLGDLSGLTSQLMSPEAYSNTIRPYLEEAYKGIGYSGMPGGSYADNALAEATQTGWYQNLGNILDSIASQQAQTATIGDLTDQLADLSGSQYTAITEPLEFIKAIQELRYGSNTSKTTSSGSSGGLLGLFG